MGGKGKDDTSNKDYTPEQRDNKDSEDKEDKNSDNNDDDGDDAPESKMLNDDLDVNK